MFKHIALETLFSEFQNTYSTLPSLSPEFTCVAYTLYALATGESVNLVNTEVETTLQEFQHIYATLFKRINKTHPFPDNQSFLSKFPNLRCCTIEPDFMINPSSSSFDSIIKELKSYLQTFEKSGQFGIYFVSTQEGFSSHMVSLHLSPFGNSEHKIYDPSLNKFQTFETIDSCCSWLGLLLLFYESNQTDGFKFDSLRFVRFFTEVSQ